jgi:hypothetical protein
MALPAPLSPSSSGFITPPRSSFSVPNSLISTHRRTARRHRPAPKKRVRTLSGNPCWLKQPSPNPPLRILRLPSRQFRPNRPLLSQASPLRPRSLSPRRPLARPRRFSPPWFRSPPRQRRASLSQNSLWPWDSVFCLAGHLLHLATKSAPDPVLPELRLTIPGFAVWLPPGKPSTLALHGRFSSLSCHFDRPCANVT